MTVPLIVAIVGWFASAILAVVLGAMVGAGIVLGLTYLYRNVFWVHIWLKFEGPQRRFVESLKKRHEGSTLDFRAAWAWDILGRRGITRRSHPHIHRYLIEIAREHSRDRQKFFAEVFGGSHEYEF